MNEQRCIAVIQSGPRRGQACGRSAYNGSQYCSQYHVRMYDREAYGRMYPWLAENRETVRSQPSRYGTIAQVPPRQTTPVPQCTRDLINLQLQDLADILREETWLQKWCKCCIGVREPVVLLKKECKADCTICTCEAESNETWSKMACGHFFHTECIRDWIKTFNTTFSSRDKGCPLCRQPVVGTIQESFITC